MSFSVPGRKAAALTAAASGLTALLSGVAVPMANAIPVDDGSGWFTDVRTSDERSAAVAVPAKPKAYDGKPVETQALYRTRSGDLAVPVELAFGHALRQGQAVTIDRQWLVDGDAIAQLATALEGASAIRCEGYSDYTGRPSHKPANAERRADRICDVLVASNTGLEATSVGYAMNRPAVVADRARDRKLNRRVVVQVTGVKVMPFAPAGLTAVGRHGELAVSFSAPETTDQPVTGYSISYDGGGSWKPVELSGDAPWTVTADGFSNGTTYDVRVRAENRWGHGPAAQVDALVATVPDAPVSVTATVNGSSVTLSVAAPAFDGGVPVTGYEVSIDGGDWAPFTSTGVDDQSVGDHVYSVRATNAVGHSAGAVSNVVTIVDPAPSAYRAQYIAGRIFTDLFWDKTPGADSYEARLDGGDWLPVTIHQDFGTQAYGYVIDPACTSPNPECTGDRTVVMRAVTGGVPGQPGEPFTVTWFSGI
jgi:hypothetical protein